MAATCQPKCGPVNKTHTEIKSRWPASLEPQELVICILEEEEEEDENVRVGITAQVKKRLPRAFVAQLFMHTLSSFINFSVLCFPHLKTWIVILWHLFCKGVEGLVKNNA